MNGQILAWTALDGAGDGVELAEISYLSEGLAISGVLAQPRRPGRHPAVIYNRGGIGDGGAVTPEVARDLLAEIAGWGYVVVASQYRGNRGSQGADEFGGADVADVLNLLPLLDSLPGVDGGRIGMWGWSRGGLMTYRALARTERVRAAISMAGVADAFDYMERRPEMEADVLSQVIPGYAANREAELEQRSALRWADRLADIPILLLHGGADWRVHPTQSLRLATALLELGRAVRLALFEGGDHGLSREQAEVRSLARAWLDRYVAERF